MTEGVLLNATISLTGGVAYLILATRCDPSGRERARWLFTTFVGIHLALAGTRQAVAYASMSDAPVVARIPIDLFAADLALFRVTTVVGALTVVPLAYAACQLVAPRAARLVTLFLAALAASGLTLFFLADVSGPHLSQWGSDWDVEGMLTRVLIIAEMGLPAGVATVIHLRANGERAQRERALGTAALIYYLAILPDALGMTGAAFIIARLAAASSVVFAWDAFRIRPGPEPVPAR